jgi:hypothetical protein
MKEFGMAIDKIKRNTERIKMKTRLQPLTPLQLCYHPGAFSIPQKPF